MDHKPHAADVLVVLGATGNQGRAILHHFASRHKYEKFILRGITRNVQSKASQELQSLGIEMISADLDSLPSLRQAFSGATHIFATTDSNQTIFRAIQDPSVLQPGQTARAYAREKELAQGKNIAEAACTTPSLNRMVWSSLPSPRRWSNGQYTKVTMFDTKDEILEMFKTNSELKGKISTLLVGFYATNALNVPKLYGPQKVRHNKHPMPKP